MTPPRWYMDHALLAAVAEKVHADRLRGYPALVDAGTLSPASAATGIRVMFAIAAGWRAIADVQPEPDWIHDPETGGAWPYERRAHLTAAARRPRAAAIDAPDDFEVVGFADAIDTLLWWETASPTARCIADGIIAAARDQRPQLKDAA